MRHWGLPVKGPTSVSFPYFVPCQHPHPSFLVLSLTPHLKWDNIGVYGLSPPIPLFTLKTSH